jgi:putative hydrolase of the HAD superfamily
VKRWTAVIFDLDDTLYLERDFVRSGFLAVANHISRTVGRAAEDIAEEFQRIFATGNRSNVFGVWLTEQGVPLDQLASMVETYRFHDPHIQPLAGVVGLLHELSQQASLGLVSDGESRTQRAKFQALRLSPFFSGVVFSDELGGQREYWKPHRRPFENVLQTLTCDPAHAVYVADNPHKDFVGPRQLGMASIRVHWPGGLHSETQVSDASLDADDHVGRIDELALRLLS